MLTLSRDDASCIVAGVSCFFLSVLLRFTASGRVKQFLCLLLGFVYTAVISGTRGVFIVSVLVSLGFLLKRKTPGRLCHSVTICFCLGFIVTVKSKLFGPISEPFGLILMLMTLRLIDANSYLSSAECKGSSRCSSIFINYCSYVCCYCGLVIGPVYSYQTFMDMIHQDHAKGSNKKVADPWVSEILFSLLMMACNAIAYFAISSLDFGSVVERDVNVLGRYGVPILLTRIIYFNLFVYKSRFRLTFGFHLSQITCFALGLGAYPKALKSKPYKGPTERQGEVAAGASSPPSDSAAPVQLDYETCRNIDDAAITTATTISTIIRKWNMTIHYFLHRHFIESYRMNRDLSSLLCFAFIAIWHGNSVGYLLFFGSVFAAMVLEKRFMYVYRQCLPYPHYERSSVLWSFHKGPPQVTLLFRVYNLVSWMIAKLLINFYGVAFIFLYPLSKIVSIWSKLYFYGFYYQAFLLLATWFRALAFSPATE